MKLEWKLKKTEHIVQDEWIDFRKEEYILPNNKEFGPFYSYSRRDYVVIVAKTKDNQYICVKQYRHGLKTVTTEFCAGGIEKNEDPFIAAKRELQEETGYNSTQWKLLLTIPSNATIADNYAHIYFADQCEKVSDLHLDDTEFLNVCMYRGEDIKNLIKNNEFQQAIHVMAFIMVENGVNLQ